MKHRTLFLVGAIVLFVYGLLWLVLPAVGLNLHGHDVVASDLASVIARYWGSAFVGLGVILWLAKEGDADSIAVRAIIGGGFVMCVTGLVAAIIDKMQASPNALIWLSIGLYALFSIWFGALLFGKKA
jgi:hypothetical protein